MVIRTSLNFAAHLVAGIAFGALAVVATSRLSREGVDMVHGPHPSPSNRQPEVES